MQFRALATDKSVAMFEKFHVYSKVELEARVEIQYEAYAKAINIEAKTMIDVASKQIVPAVIGYTKSLADTIHGSDSVPVHRQPYRQVC